MLNGDQLQQIDDVLAEVLKDNSKDLLDMLKRYIMDYMRSNRCPADRISIMESSNYALSFIKDNTPFDGAIAEKVMNQLKEKGE